ncbi:MAG: hypothetical protein HFI14_12685 [Lachnospiraceae bacterium]|nr:hypothetical protein [Lachnospiraceae bacterium]
MRNIIWLVDTVRIQAHKYQEECADSPSVKEKLDTLAKIRRLKKELRELGFFKKQLYKQSVNLSRSASQKMLGQIRILTRCLHCIL